MQTVYQIDVAAIARCVWFNRFSSARNNAENNCRAVIYTIEKYINRFTPKSIPRVCGEKKMPRKSRSDRNLYRNQHSPFDFSLIIYIGT